MSSAARSQRPNRQGTGTDAERGNLDPREMDSCRRRPGVSGILSPDSDVCICMETGKLTRMFSQIPSSQFPRALRRSLIVCLLRPDPSPAASYIRLLPRPFPLSQSPPCRPSAPSLPPCPLPLRWPHSSVMSIRHTPRQAERDIRLHDPHHSHSLPPPSHPHSHPPHMNGNGLATPAAHAGPSRGPLGPPVLSPSTQPTTVNGDEKTNPVAVLNQANEQTWLMIGRCPPRAPLLQSCQSD